MVEVYDLFIKELYCLRDFECCAWQDGPTIQDARFQTWRSAVNTAAIIRAMYHTKNQADDEQYYQERSRIPCHGPPSLSIRG